MFTEDAAAGSGRLFWAVKLQNLDRADRLVRRKTLYTASQRGPTSGVDFCPAPRSWELGARHGWALVPLVVGPLLLPDLEVRLNSTATGAKSCTARVCHPRRHRHITTHAPHSFLHHKIWDRFSKRNPLHEDGPRPRSLPMERKFKKPRLQKN